MTEEKGRKKGTSPVEGGKPDSKSGAKPVPSTGGAISDIANTKVSRRTLLRGTATAATVVGVSAVAMKSTQLLSVREQSASSSTTSYVTISPTQTNTATVPPPPVVVATDPFGLRTITLNINGTNYSVDVEPRSMLVDVLRNSLGLTATKKACSRMECGACTVLIDGAPQEACTYIALRAVGHNIVTSEIATSDPVVNALQQAWVTADAAQCGYCGPGLIMAAAALLKSNPNPTVAEIKAALSGNLCRCGNYLNIISSVQLAATNLGGA